jgi:hypothetical protein
MRILTTLLVLLLSSPVFGETWLCSWSDNNGEIFNDAYVRAANGFDEPRDGDALTFTWEIVYEDERALVLHSTTTTGNAVGGYFFTSITQIEKNGENRFVQILISPMNPVQLTTEGECVVV